MRLRRLVAEGFRNLEPLELELDAQFVVFHGPNAQGKTNALEAIHLLATLKPLRGRKVRELVRWGSRAAAVAADVEHGGVTGRHRVDLAAEGRTASLDGKKVSDLQEYFAGIRAIAFVPSDGEIVTGEPGRRRNWLDRAVFTASPAHLDRVRAVRRVLDQKAALLRSDRPDRALLEVLDAQLARVGAELVERREALLRELEPHVRELHGTIAGGHGEVTLELQTHARGATLAERIEALAERLAAVRDREIERRTTLAGPQQDDVRITLDDRSARDFASRGQVRSLVLSLKLAEMVAARARGEVPMFLIDDASTELDRGRTGRLIRLLGELDAQVLATTTDPGPLVDALPAGTTRTVRVASGVLTAGE